MLAPLLALSLVAVAPAHAGPGESDFVSRVNSARSSRGLGTYRLRSELTYVARRHAARMASRRTIYHNANLGSEVSNWRAIAENVGKGSSVSAIHNAFMASSSHRANILSRTYTELGVGTATDSGGTLYVVQIFRLPMRTTSYSAPAPAPAPRRTAVTRRPARASRTRVVARPPARRAVPAWVLLRARVARADVFAARSRARGDDMLRQIFTYHDALRIVGTT